MSSAVENNPKTSSKLNLLEKVMAQARLEAYPDRCLRLRHRKSGCSTCQDNCPVHAITLGDSPNIDYSRCCGCGICANLCPTEAFQLGGYSYNSLLARVKGRHEIELHCAGVATGKDGVAVPCLGYLNESFLIGAIACGAREVKLNSAVCQDCQLHLGFQVARGSLRQANRLLAIYGRPEKARFATSDQPNIQSQLDNPQYSRREVFSYIARGARKMAAQATDSAEIASQGVNRARACLIPRLPNKRRLLLQSLQSLGEPVIAKVERKDLPFLQIEIAGECDGCGLCVTFCPTGALGSSSNDTTEIIDFNTGDCLACGLCRQVCPKNAIDFLNEIMLNDIVSSERRTLKEHRKTICPQCGQTLTVNGGSNLCLDCRKKRAMMGWLTKA